jgi:IS5 family transposase
LAVKRTGEAGFVEQWLAPGVGANAQLDRLDGLVKWYRFEKLLGRMRDPQGPGRKGYGALVLFKSLLLQSLYGLSDRELEQALGDRLSFRRFVGLTLEDSTPDHTVLNRFRNGLVGSGLLERLFGELDRQLDAAGVILRQGTMLDATLIETSAVARPRRDEAPVDPDAGLTSRKGKPGMTYGYKAHVAVDEGSGMIRRAITTAANVNETTVADRLIIGDEAVVWADAAYDTRARRAALKASGVKARIARRPHWTSGGLPPRLKRYNQLIARRRAAVETTFATFKRRMGLTSIRYIGLVKASAQVLMAAIAFNLRRWAALQAA